MERTSGTVYMLANRKQGALYTGVTSNLPGRIHQHRTDATLGFATRSGIKRLVWFEQHWEIADAIQRETQIKRWRRAWKIELIEKDNPNWDDLAVKLLGFEPLRGVSTVAHAVREGDGLPLSPE